MIGQQGTVLPVGLICTYVKQIFEAEEMLHGVTVLGEVSNLRTVNGYVYFNLKDNDGVLPCACFGLARGELPVDGDKVYVNGSLSFYSKGGRISFIVSKIYYAGLGDIMLKYLQVKNMLEEEGLFSDEYKKPIPRFPKKICVVTSKSGAVIRDIVRTIRNKNKITDISVVDVRVQGEDAVLDIVKGLKVADKTGSDVIILARGGGSWEDLIPFCDESVARAVFEVKTPIITAIGHETDTTLVDYVSDMRASTPTGAGEYLAFDTKELIGEISTKLDRISRRVSDKFDKTSSEIKSKILYVCAKAEGVQDTAKNKIINLLNVSYSTLNARMKQDALRLTSLIEKIDASNPLKRLKKGLYRVSIDGTTAISEEMFDVGKTLTVDTLNSEIDAKITEIRRK